MHALQVSVGVNFRMATKELCRWASKSFACLGSLFSRFFQPSDLFSFIGSHFWVMLLARLASGRKKAGASVLDAIMSIHVM
jgi:hypothetical protein